MAAPARVYRESPSHGRTGRGWLSHVVHELRDWKSHAFGGKYIELTPSTQIRYTDRFEDPNMPGEMRVTISFERVSCGTSLTIVQEGIPAAIPAELCYLGWQESLALLAHLVEPEIPDGT